MIEQMTHWVLVPVGGTQLGANNDHLFLFSAGAFDFVPCL